MARFGFAAAVGFAKVIRSRLSMMSAVAAVSFRDSGRYSAVSGVYVVPRSGPKRILSRNRNIGLHIRSEHEDMIFKFWEFKESNVLSKKHD